MSRAKANNNAESFALDIVKTQSIAIITGGDFGVSEMVYADISGHIRKAIDADGAASLTESDVADNFEDVLERLEAQDLWGGRKVFGLRLDSERQAKRIINLLQTHEARPFANILVILARKLNAKGTIKKALASLRKTKIFYCQADTADDLGQFLQAHFDDLGTQIAPDALALLTQTYLGARGLAAQEAEKLALYALSQEQVLSRDDVGAISLNKSEYGFQELIHPILDGELNKIAPTFNRLLASGKGEISVLRALQNETQRMLDVKLALVNGMPRPELACKPPVFKHDWSDFQKRLKKWPTPYLLRVIERIAECEAQTRLDGKLARPMVLNLCCDLAKTAARI